MLDHSSASYTLANPMLGQVRVTQRGTGKTVLTSSNSTVGTTTVSAGTLALSAASNNIAFTTAIEVAAGAVFDVTGVTGGFALAGGQTLAGAGLVAGGMTTLATSTVAFTVGSPRTEPAYVFASYASLAGTFGTVTGLPSGYTIDYHYLGGNQVALVAVPEPGVAVLGIMGCAVAAAIIRRRRG